MLIELVNFGDAPRLAGKFDLAGEFATSRSLFPVFQLIGVDMRRVEKIQFNSQGRRGGSSWKKLKDDTVKRKGNTRILFTRGSNPGYGSGHDELFQSLTRKGAPGSIFNIVGYELEFGTAVDHAGVHQAGYPPQGIPARPFFVFTIRDYDRWTDMILKHLMKPFRTSGRVASK